jgi:hypothetical protein
VSGFELSALEPVFRAIKLADLDLVLVGGHAVSFYAVRLVTEKRWWLVQSYLKVVTGVLTELL